MEKFTDYVVTVIAVGAGIVGLKVLSGIVFSKWLKGNIPEAINNVFQAM